MKVKTKAGWFRFFYDLHVSGGFYAASLLLILALTGLTWSFGWYRNAFYSVFGISANPPQAHHAPASSGARKPAKKKTDYTQWAEVLSALKAIIRTLTQSRSKMAPLRFLRPVMEIQEEATVTPLILQRVRLRKSNYIKISRNRGR